MKKGPRPTSKRDRWRHVGAIEKTACARRIQKALELAGGRSKEQIVGGVNEFVAEEERAIPTGASIREIEEETGAARRGLAGQARCREDESGVAETRGRARRRRFVAGKSLRCRSLRLPWEI